ncbi:hypothetical protein SAMN02745166_01263 [Prosthecobacter debontii]|uniref:Uncharacterized protein n=1 Tax=Prosthecobacter debontii TaxID=48467 RepID=A0A1T4X9D0_9BACT|nr:hypothetical protein [Prosthecobacter debontii]SKA86204.1 hypothetical protein SAMN02745166_01263 [Prosthecobacter debontii]
MEINATRYRAPSERDVDLSMGALAPPGLAAWAESCGPSGRARTHI